MSDGITEARKGFSSYDPSAQRVGLNLVKDENIQKTYIFRVKVDKLHYDDVNFKSEPDGSIFVITDNPSIIYDKIQIDNIISIEKISHGYIFK